MFNPSRILVLAPHADDGELGCGGSIAKFCALGKEVFYAAFCLCSKSLAKNFAGNTLEMECKEATSLLGITSSHVILFNYEVRELPQSRQMILEELLKLNKDIKPDMVLLPAASDIHQDHQVIHQEGVRAFKNKKFESLKAYKSQEHRNYMKEDFIRSLAKVRGVQADSEFAEAFEVYRWII